MMIKRFFVFILNKFWGVRYVEFSKIDSHIAFAKKNEQRRMQKIMNDEINNIIEQIEIKKKLELAELKAENEQLISQINEFNKNKKTHQNIYHKNEKRAKDLQEISENQVKNARDLLNMVAGIVGIIEGNHNRVCDQVNEIERMEKKDKKQLGMI